MNRFKEESLDFFAENQDDVLDLLTQISVLYTQEQTLKWRNELISLLDNLIQKRINPLKMAHAQETRNDVAQRQSHVSDVSDESNEQILKNMRDRSVRLKHATKAVHDSVQRIANALKNLVSIRGASSQNQNLKRLERAAAISSNVDRAKNTTTKQRMEMIEENCQDFGVGICNLESLDSGKVAEALRAVGAGKFLEWMNIYENPKIASLSSRMPFLDGLTLGILLGK